MLFRSFSSGAKSSIEPDKKAIYDLAFISSKIRDYAIKTLKGKYESDPDKKNQDSEFFHKNFAKIKNAFAFGVLDGHGVNGHLVSSFVKNHYVSNLELCVLQSLRKGVVKKPVPRAKSTMSVQDPLGNSPVLRPEVYLEAFKMTDKNLTDSTIDISCSGTTLNTVLLLGNFLVCANVGDSRAVIGTLLGSSWTAKQISMDHKPNVSEEGERIIKMGGRVQAVSNGSGPLRVWLKDENIPGIAMSRSFGDKIAESVGVIWTPEITSEILNDNDKVLILASDGVWELMDNLRAINIVGKYWSKGEAKEAAEELVEEARQKWIDDDDGSIDDITAIVVFFN